MRAFASLAQIAVPWRNYSGHSSARCPAGFCAGGSSNEIAFPLQLAATPLTIRVAPPSTCRSDTSKTPLKSVRNSLDRASSSVQVAFIFITRENWPRYFWFQNVRMRAPIGEEGGGSTDAPEITTACI